MYLLKKSIPLLVALCFGNSGFSQSGNGMVAYRVTTTAGLNVRKWGDAKAEVLFTLPKDYYVLSRDSVADLKKVKVGATEGHWISFLDIGSVFDAFLTRDNAVEFQSNCQLEGMKVSCDGDEYAINAQTAVVGTYRLSLRNCTYERPVFDRSQKLIPLLEKMARDNAPNSVVYLTTGKRVVQISLSALGCGP